MRQDSVLNIPHLKIICDRSTKPQAVTSNRSTLTTVIAAGNALGNYVPQYYVFKRKVGTQISWKMRHQERMEGCQKLDGPTVRCSRTTWQNSSSSTSGLLSSQPLFCMMSINPLTDRAKRHNIILFFYPCTLVIWPNLWVSACLVQWRECSTKNASCPCRRILGFT